MSKRTEIDAVRQCLTSDIPPIDAAARSAARARALGPAPATRARRGALRSRPLVSRVVPAVALTTLAVTLVVALSGGARSGVPGPFEVPSAAAAILNRAAAHLAAGGALRGAQARVIREDMLQLVGGQAKDGSTYYYVLPRTVEQGFDSLGNAFYEELPDGRPRFADAAAKAGYVRALGRYVAIAPKPRIEQHFGVDGSDPNVLNLSARQVLGLPTDPARLKARLQRQRPGLRAQADPESLVSMATRLLTFGPTPPAVQAAVARLLAQLPGVHRVGTERIGRRTADVLSFPGGTRLAFDRRTGQLLEQIDVLARRSRGYPGVRPGTVVDVTAFTTRIAPTIDTPITVPASRPVQAPTAPASPAATPPPDTRPCRAPFPGYDTDVNVYSVHSTGTTVTVLLQRIEADCEGHGRFGVMPVGARYTATLARAARIQILNRLTGKPERATLSQLEYGLSHPRRSGWFDGAAFALETSTSDEITGLAELFGGP